MGGGPERNLGAGEPMWPAAAALVREKIADGTLRPGDLAPSGEALARETGLHALTCRRALRALLADGTLRAGVSPTGRPRIARPGGSGPSVPDALRAALSRSLAARRKAAGLTQPELAEKTGMSVTTVGHAETGRTWQSREFWRLAGQVLGDDGALLALYDRCQIGVPAGVPDEDEPDEDAPDEAAPVLPASVTITPAGVLVVWPDGTETLALPPGG
jgi:transcriptional regulator with XRE-family HTH domain